MRSEKCEHEKKVSRKNGGEVTSETFRNISPQSKLQTKKNVTNENCVNMHWKKSLGKMTHKHILFYKKFNSLTATYILPTIPLQRIQNTFQVTSMKKRFFVLSAFCATLFFSSRQLYAFVCFTQSRSVWRLQNACSIVCVGTCFSHCNFDNRSFPQAHTHTSWRCNVQTFWYENDRSKMNVFYLYKKK